MPSKKNETLESLARRIRQCTQCPLYETRNNAVPGEGPSNARLMIVGEAPGEKEDREGRPFCGRAGVCFDQLLAEGKLQREDIFISSAVKCRPPRNRNPYVNELNTCRQLWLEKQIELLNPSLILLLGKIPWKQLFGTKAKLGDLHGKIHKRQGYRYMVTYHPAAAMRFPVARKNAFADFRRVQRLLE
jgi:DNA polymerase